MKLGWMEVNREKPVQEHVSLLSAVPVSASIMKVRSMTG